MKFFWWMLGLGCLSVVIELLMVWDAFQPKVGVVGNGPDPENIWSIFGYGLSIPLLFFMLAGAELYDAYQANEERVKAEEENNPSGHSG